MPRRAKRDKRKEEYFKTLTKGEYGLFDTMKDVFMLSAVIGYNLGDKEEIKRAGGNIPWSVFDDQDEYIMNIIALAYTKDMDIVLDEQFENKLTLIEEFANRGIEELINQIVEKPGDGMDNLLEFILQEDTSEEKILVDLSTKIDDIF